MKWWTKWKALKRFLPCPGQDSESEHTPGGIASTLRDLRIQGWLSPPNPHPIYLCELLQKPDVLWQMTMNTVNLTK